MNRDLDRFLAYRQDPQVARFQSWSTLSSTEAQSFMHTAEIGLPGEWCAEHTFELEKKEW